MKGGANEGGIYNSIDYDSCGVEEGTANLGHPALIHQKKKKKKGFLLH